MTIRYLLAAPVFCICLVVAGVANADSYGTDPCRTGQQITVTPGTTPPSSDTTNPVPDIGGVCWTELKGSQVVYAGKTLQSTCNDGPLVIETKKPARNPLPCAADEMQSGHYNYYDRLNWSIAAAERLNRWENDLEPRPVSRGNALNCWDTPVSREDRIARARELDVNPPPGRKGNECDYK